MMHDARKQRCGRQASQRNPWKHYEGILRAVYVKFWLQLTHCVMLSMSSCMSKEQAKGETPQLARKSCNPPGRPCRRPRAAPLQRNGNSAHQLCGG